MRRKIGILVLVFVAMILIAGLVGLFVPAVAPPSRLPPKPLPNPNGYDTFMQAGSMLPGRVHVDEINTISRDELVLLVEANSNAMQLARTGLGQECRIPLRQYPEPTNTLYHLFVLKQLVYAFQAEGRLAEMENRPADAARSYLDAIQLGIDSSQGGVLVDAMVGRTIESVRVYYLSRLEASLDAKSCAEIASRLETIDSGREQWENIVAQEYDRVQRHPGFTYRLTRWFKAGSEKEILESEQKRFGEQTAKTRRLTIDFASRAYELKHQQKPTNFTDLVPDYLKAIPQDPLTGTNMTLLP